LWLQVGQEAGGRLEVPAHVAGQRVQHRPIGPGRLHIGLAQQCREAMDVATESREFGAGSHQGSDVLGAAAPGEQHGHVCDETGEVGSARQARSARAFRELSSLLSGHPNRQLDVDGTRSASVWRLHAAGFTVHRKPEIARNRATHQHRHADAICLRARHQRGLQATHVDRDEVMGSGVHEPTNGGARSACETGGRPPISALTLMTSIGSDQGSLPARFGPKCRTVGPPRHTYDGHVLGVGYAMSRQRLGSDQTLHRPGQELVRQCTRRAAFAKQMHNACTGPD